LLPFYEEDKGAVSKLRMDHDRNGLAAADAAVKFALANERQARVNLQETA
jgi:hypothetical protein